MSAAEALKAARAVGIHLEVEGDDLLLEASAPARMAKMRARRASFTDPRDGRLKKQIRWAFWLSQGEDRKSTRLNSSH